MPSLIVTPAKLALIPLSILAIFISAMIYHDTKRLLWHLKTSLPNFLLTAAAAASLFISPGFFAITILTLISLESAFLLPAREATWSPRKHSARLRLKLLWRITFSRILTAVITIPLAFLSPWATLPVLLLSELCSRHLFFRSVQVPKMPGGLEIPLHN